MATGDFVSPPALHTGVDLKDSRSIADSQNILGVMHRIRRSQEVARIRRPMQHERDRRLAAEDRRALDRNGRVLYSRAPTASAMVKTQQVVPSTGPLSYLLGAMTYPSLGTATP